MTLHAPEHPSAPTHTQATNTRGHAIKLKEAAKRLDVAERTLYAWEKRGILRFVRIGGCTRVPVSELERLLTLTPRADAHSVEPELLTHDDVWTADHQTD